MLTASNCFWIQFDQWCSFGASSIGAPITFAIVRDGYGLANASTKSQRREEAVEAEAAAAAEAEAEAGKEAAAEAEAEAAVARARRSSRKPLIIGR